MKIGLLFPAEYSKGNHVWEKAELQARTLRELGHDVLFWSFLRRGAQPSTACTEHRHLPMDFTNRRGKARAMENLVDDLLRVKPDVVYVRRGFWHSAYGRMMRAIPTVAEINTDEAQEFRLTTSLPRQLYYRLTERFWKRLPAGFVAVTRDLAKLAPPGKPVTVIANGLVLRETMPVPPATTPHLLFSATGGYAWHGIDKFFKLASFFPDWRFTFIGELPRGFEEQSLPNLHCTGKLPVDEADALLQEANIGVGTLAAHRKGLNEACPLKVRKYLGAGLPCILGYEDTDFTPDHWFICQIPNSEDNVVSAREQIAAFVQAQFRSRVPAEEISFATEIAKARMRSEFFQTLVSDRFPAEKQPSRG